MKDHIIIFIKNPQSGKVKTRISNTLGHDEALRIYIILLEEIRKTTLQVNAERHLFYSDYISEDDKWSRDDFRKFIQTGHDLGERMKIAFENIFKSLPSDQGHKVIIVGSDCPYLTPAIFEEAFLTLDNNDVVIGPAFDGGYYLLGMKNFLPYLFECIEWSTSQVLTQTIHILNLLNNTYHLLPVLHDIDTEDDWLRYNKSSLF